MKLCMQNRKVARRNDDANLKGLSDICFGQTLVENICTTD